MPRHRPGARQKDMCQKPRCQAANATGLPQPKRSRRIPVCRGQGEAGRRSKASLNNTDETNSSFAGAPVNGASIMLLIHLRLRIALRLKLPKRVFALFRVLRSWLS